MRASFATAVHEGLCVFVCACMYEGLSRCGLCVCVESSPCVCVCVYINESCERVCMCVYVLNVCVCVLPPLGTDRHPYVEADEQGAKDAVS